MSTKDRHTSNARKLLTYIHELPKDKLDSIRGNPEKVLKEIDQFSKHVQVMNIGEIKGKIIVDKIRERKPSIMVELGCYFGYSAVMFGHELKSNPKSKYYSFEANPEYAEIAREVIDLAGLSDKVEILVGKASENLPKFQRVLKDKHGSDAKVDFIFIDHWKDLYLPDLRVIESLALIEPGTFIVADNIYRPGAPEYVRYVQMAPKLKEEYDTRTENVSGVKYTGNWDLLYESHTKEVPEESDALEMTLCVGMDSEL